MHIKWGNDDNNRENEQLNNKGIKILDKNQSKPCKTIFLDGQLDHLNKKGITSKNISAPTERKKIRAGPLLLSFPHFIFKHWFANVYALMVQT